MIKTLVLAAALITQLPRELLIEAAAYQELDNGTCKRISGEVKTSVTLAIASAVPPIDDKELEMALKSVKKEKQTFTASEWCKFYSLSAETVHAFMHGKRY